MSDKDLGLFSMKFYVYINQVFGEEQVRQKILEMFNLPLETLKVLKAIDDQTEEEWLHHVAYDINSGKQLDSVNMGIQDVYSDDIACQSYSLYNALYYNKEYIYTQNIDESKKELVYNLEKLNNITRISRTKRSKYLQANIKKIADLLLWLIEQNELRDEINSLNFERLLKDDDNKYIFKGRGKYLSSVLINIEETLNEWKDYGYKFFKKS